MEGQAGRGGFKIQKLAAHSFSWGCCQVETAVVIAGEKKKYGWYDRATGVGRPKQN